MPSRIPQSLFDSAIWNDPDHRRRWPAASVVVLTWPIDRPYHLADALLAPAELERAERFRFEADATAFRVARAGMRTILGEWLGVAPPDVPLIEGASGKPAIDAARIRQPPRFNLSHSGGLAVLALSEGRELGVDIERIPTDKPIPQGVAERCFVGAELAALEQGTEGERRETFYRLWTRKEAIVKLLGDGLQAPLTDFQVEPATETAAWVDLPSGNRLGINRCWLQSVPANEGYTAALACEQKPTAVECHRLRLRDDSPQ